MHGVCIYHMERERLKDGRGRGRSWRLLLEVIASSFMENSLNNFIIHFSRSTTLPLLRFLLALWVAVREESCVGCDMMEMENTTTSFYFFLVGEGICVIKLSIWNFRFRVGRVTYACLPFPPSSPLFSPRLLLIQYKFSLFFFFL